QPENDLEFERNVAITRKKIADKDNSRQQCHDLKHEHHGVLDQRGRVELDKSLTDRRDHDLGVQQRRHRHPLANLRGFHFLNSGKKRQNVVPATIANCSTRGPSASAGKKVRPPTITITPTTKPT